MPTKEFFAGLAGCAVFAMLSFADWNANNLFAQMLSLVSLGFLIWGILKLK